jgi:peptidoglycan/xylan/chitin deacetylase (PgdA/CDA1 family)
MRFYDTLKCITQYKEIAFSIILVLLISLLFQNVYSISDILAFGQKRISEDNLIPLIGEGTQIQTSQHNNTFTKTKIIHNINNDDKADGILNTILSDTNNNSNAKVVILTFGDTWKSQVTTAKPILDQYGFKASFFITCSYANDQKHTQQRMNWNDISSLQEDGQDIESKGMTPVDLKNLSSAALNYQIGSSKQCLETHGINSPNIFAAKYGDVWNNKTVIDAISKYYRLADNGFANSMFLHCDGYNGSISEQNDCRTYDDNGMLTYANRYSIREDSHNAWDRKYLHNDQIIFQKFVEEANSGINFNNKKAMVDAIPIVAYHIIDNSQNPFSTDVSLFAAEMKYLHDNGFKVIPMSELGYDENRNVMFIQTIMQ